MSRPQYSDYDLVAGDAADFENVAFTSGQTVTLVANYTPSHADRLLIGGYASQDCEIRVYQRKIGEHWKGYTSIPVTGGSVSPSHLATIEYLGGPVKVEVVGGATGGTLDWEFAVRGWGQ